ncbi:MAG: hypothetical protein N3H30_02000 [Candidatus Micrarchaeota archaeon]|nr:hypothetical protein [Candidatus Micrarchaeota archaeon]
MHNRIILACVMLTAILLFGCIGGQQQQGTGAPQTGGGSDNVPNGGAAGGHGTPASDGGQGGSVPNNGSPGGHGTGSTSGGTIEDAIKAGIPYECITTVTQGGMASTTHLWIKGENLYIEATQMGTQVNLVVKGKGIYADASRQPYSAYKQVPGYGDCAWILFESNETGETYEKMPTDLGFYTQPQQGYKVECKPAMFGDEKFATPGRVCNVNDIMNAMMSGMPPGYGYPQ